MRDDTLETIREFIETLTSSLPEIVGVDEIFSGCEVTAIDPLAVGIATLPRYIQVRLKGGTAAAGGTLQLVLWRGTPSLAVGDDCAVIRYKEGNRYEVVGSSGSGGTVTPTDVYLYIWVYDVSEGVLIAYTTIAAALAYAALASGDYVLIPPGTYDESFTLVNGVIITEQIPGTVIINSTSANTAVTTISGGYINVKEILCTRNVAATIEAVLASHAAGECNIYAEEIKGENTNAAGTGIGVHQTGAGTTNIYSNWLIGEGATAYGARLAAAGTQWVFGNCEATATTGIARGASCETASGIQRILGNCYAYNGSTPTGAEASNGTQTVYGSCISSTSDAGSSAYGAAASGGVQTVMALCSATAGAGAGTSAGAYCTSSGAQTIYSAAIGTGSNNSNGALTGATATTQNIHGDVTGDHYGANCAGGTVTLSSGTASGATNDLIRSGGTLQIRGIAFDSFSGTINFAEGDRWPVHIVTFDPTNNDLNPYTTIQAAITAASSGDIVFVPPGTHTESITLKNGVSVVGIGQREDVIIASTTLSAPVTTAPGGWLENVTLSVNAAASAAIGVLGTHTGICRLRHITINVLSSNSDATGIILAIGNSTTILDVEDVEIDVETSANGNTAYGVSNVSSGAVNIRRFNIVSEASAGAGDAYGLRNSAAAGSVTGRHGQITTTAPTLVYDLNHAGGTLSAFSIQHTTTNGTITWLDGDALESLKSYTRGYIIRGGAADWEAYSALTDGAALIGDGTDVISDTTPTWKGRHQFDAGATFETGVASFGTPTQLTIAGGVITATKSYHTVETQGGGSPDDLDTINGGIDGALLVIRPADATHTVVAKDGTGNLSLAGDFSMDDDDDTLSLIYDDTLSVWLELSRSDNA